MRCNNETLQFQFKFHFISDSVKRPPWLDVLENEAHDRAEVVRVEGQGRRLRHVRAFRLVDRLCSTIARTAIAVHCARRRCAFLVPVTKHTQLRADLKRLHLVFQGLPGRNINWNLLHDVGEDTPHFDVTRRHLDGAQVEDVTQQQVRGVAGELQV